MDPKERKDNLGGFDELNRKKANPADKVEDNRERHQEKELDHGLKETFPASDPVSISPGAD